MLIYIYIYKFINGISVQSVKKKLAPKEQPCKLNPNIPHQGKILNRIQHNNTVSIIKKLN